MKQAWPLVALGEVLSGVSRPVPVLADREYRMLGTKWYAQGLFTREVLPGTQIAAKQVYAVEEGDFVQ